MSFFMMYLGTFIMQILKRGQDIVMLHLCGYRLLWKTNPWWAKFLDWYCALKLTFHTTDEKASRKNKSFSAQSINEAVQRN